MDVYYLVICYSVVVFLWIFFGGVMEEIVCDGFLCLGCCFVIRYYVKFMFKNVIDMIRFILLEFILIIV